MNKKQIVISLSIAICTLFIGFATGSFYQARKTRGFNSGNFQKRFENGKTMMQENGQPGGNRAIGMKPVIGEVLSFEGDILTVKLSNGESKMVLLTEKTAIGKSSVAKKEDIKIGEKLTVIGTDNADGTTTATDIRLGDGYPINN